MVTLMVIWAVLGTGIYMMEKGIPDTKYTDALATYYYTITTVSTTGYGDISPASPMGRILATLLMAVGALSVSMITANIASYLVELQVREGKGLTGFKLRDHFVLCGWKEELPSILRDILLVNPDMDPDNIVVVNTADPKLMDNIRENPAMKNIKYVHGEYNDDRVLVRASIENAKTALVLADMTNPAAHTHEIDSRTLTGVLTLRNMSRDLYILAELLDNRLEKHLRLSGADEIILSKHYSQRLIANASVGTGISQVVRDLIDVHKETIRVVPYPDQFVGKTFKDLMEHYQSTNADLLIGILENAGNVYHRKSEAIREAQKEPDISKLVKNLQFVKELVPNQPVLNPGLDYVIKRHSRAIVLGHGLRSVHDKAAPQTTHA